MKISKKKDKNEIKEGQKIGFMKTKGQTTKLRLKFMQNKNVKIKKSGTMKKKRSANNPDVKEGKYSGQEMIESQRFKKVSGVTFFFFFFQRRIIVKF